MGEVAVALIRRRPDFRLVARRARSISFGGEPEKRPVLDDRSADAAAVQAVVRVGKAGLLLTETGFLIEEILRLSPDGPRLVEAAAVIIIRARLRGDVEHTAAGPPHLGVVSVDLDLHFFERLDGRVQHGAAAQFRDGNTIDQVVVRADPSASKRQARGVRLVLLPVELRIADRHDGRDRDADHERVSAGRGKRFERFAVERRRVRRVGGVDERRLTGDRNRLFECANLQNDVERDELLRSDGQPLRFVCLVSRQLSLQRVRAGWHRREVVLPHLVRDGVARDVRRFVRQRHRHAGNDAVGIPHLAANTARELLCADRCCRCCQKYRAQKNAGKTPHSSLPDEKVTRTRSCEQISKQQVCQDAGRF